MRFQAASLSPATYLTAQRRLGNHVVNPEEEKERLQWEGFAEKKVSSLE